MNGSEIAFWQTWWWQIIILIIGGLIGWIIARTIYRRQKREGETSKKALAKNIEETIYGFIQPIYRALRIPEDQIAPMSKMMGNILSSRILPLFGPVMRSTTETIVFENTGETPEVETPEAGANILRDPYETDLADSTMESPAGSDEKEEEPPEDQ